MIVAFSDPNFSYTGSELMRALSDWYAAIAKPAIDTLFDGRAGLWIIAITFGLWLCGKAFDSSKPGYAHVAVSVISAVSTMVVAAGAPFATYLLLPDRLWRSRDQILAFMVAYGPIIPLMAGVALGVAICPLSASRTSRTHDTTPSL